MLIGLPAEKKILSPFLSQKLLTTNPNVVHRSQRNIW